MVGSLAGPGQGGLMLPVLLLPHGCAYIKHPQHVLLSTCLATAEVSFPPTSGLQVRQCCIAEPGHRIEGVVVESVVHDLLAAIYLPVVIHLQTTMAGASKV
jgi:hypothetical protein